MRTAAANSQKPCLAAPARRLVHSCPAVHALQRQAWPLLGLCGPRALCRTDAATSCMAHTCTYIYEPVIEWTRRWARRCATWPSFSTWTWSASSQRLHSRSAGPWNYKLQTQFAH